MEMGMAITAVTMLGMLGLLIAAVGMEDEPRPCDRTEGKPAARDERSRRAA